MKRLLFIAALLLAGPVWGQSQAVNTASTYQVLNDDSHFKSSQANESDHEYSWGVSYALPMREDPAEPGQDKILFVQPVTDPRTAGWTTDSILYFLKYAAVESDNLAGGDTIRADGYLLNTEWHESLSMTSETDLDSCGVTWDSSMSRGGNGSATCDQAAWTTPGALHADDAEQTPFDAGYYGGTSDIWDTLRIVGQTSCDKFFDYGAVLRLEEQAGEVSEDQHFFYTEGCNTGTCPNDEEDEHYIIVYMSPPAAGRAFGAGTSGAATVGAGSDQAQ